MLWPKIEHQKGVNHFWKCLRELRKGFEKLFGVCAGRASSAAFTETFAQAAQVPPHLPRRLRRLRKFRRICRDVCAGCASSAAFAETFAGVPQVPREMLWRLQHRCKHFQKRFALLGGMNRRVSALIGPIQAQAARQPASLRTNLPFNGVPKTSSPPAGVRVRMLQWSELCCR